MTNATKFKVGDRVQLTIDNGWSGRYGRKGEIGTVLSVGADDGNYLVSFEESGECHAWHSLLTPAPPVASQQGIGATVAMLRKAAGLPAFMVGDVVNYKWGRDTKRNVWQGVTIDEVEPGRYGTFYKAHCPNAGRGNFVTHWLELVTPAPCSTPAANDNHRAPVVPAADAKPTGAQAGRRFRVGQWVRDIDYGVCRVDYVGYRDGAIVKTLGGETSFADDHHLSPWLPRIGEHVKILSNQFNERGKIAIVDYIYSDTKYGVQLVDEPGETTAYFLDEIEPCLQPVRRAAADSPWRRAQHAPRYKAGDTVMFLDGPAVVTGNSDSPAGGVHVTTLIGENAVNCLVSESDLTPLAA